MRVKQRENRRRKKKRKKKKEKKAKGEGEKKEGRKFRMYVWNRELERFEFNDCSLVRSLDNSSMNDAFNNEKNERDRKIEKKKKIWRRK